MISTAILFLAAISPVADDDAKTFQGKWTVTKMQINGNKAADTDLEGMDIVVDADGYKLRRAGTVAEEGTAKFFPDKTPKEVDFTATEGENKGKTQLGLYKFEGDTMTICVSEPGVKTRPTDFTAEEGSNRFLVVIKKVK